MARNFFSVPSPTIALAAAVAKSVVGALSSTNVCLNLTGFIASFDGATSSNAPVLVELGTCTFGTNTPGTGGSSTVTPAKNDTGRAETVQATAAKGWTSEPTAITSYKGINIGQFNGAYEFVVPFSTPIVFIGAKGGVVRCTSPNIVNCSSDLFLEE
jgi:hypothetical protein